MFFAISKRRRHVSCACGPRSLILRWVFVERAKSIGRGKSGGKDAGDGEGRMNERLQKQWLAVVNDGSQWSDDVMACGTQLDRPSASCVTSDWRHVAMSTDSTHDVIAAVTMPNPLSLAPPIALPKRLFRPHPSYIAFTCAPTILTIMIAICPTAVCTCVV